jgi:C-terminal processing protease CtpA/Prc
MLTTFRVLVIIAVTLFLVRLTENSVMAVEESGGIGLKVSQLYNYTTKDDDKRGSIVVLEVFKGSPAQKHGIQKGDIILKVNDEVTKNHDFKDLLHDHLRGPSFTEVILELWRPSTQEKFEFTIQRNPMVY